MPKNLLLTVSRYIKIYFQKKKLNRYHHFDRACLRVLLSRHRCAPVPGTKLLSARPLCCVPVGRPHCSWLRRRRIASGHRCRASDRSVRRKASLARVGDAGEGRQRSATEMYTKEARSYVKNKWSSLRKWNDRVRRYVIIALNATSVIVNNHDSIVTVVVTIVG